MRDEADDYVYDAGGATRHVTEKGRKILRKSQKYGKVTVLAYNMVMKVSSSRKTLVCVS